MLSLLMIQSPAQTSVLSFRVPTLTPIIEPMVTIWTLNESSSIQIIQVRKVVSDSIVYNWVYWKALQKTAAVVERFHRLILRKSLNRL